MKENNMEIRNEALRVSFCIDTSSNKVYAEICGGHCPIGIYKRWDFDFDFSSSETYKALKEQMFAEGMMDIYPDYQSDEIEDLFLQLYEEIFNPIIDSEIIPTLNKYIGTKFHYFAQEGTHKEHNGDWRFFGTGVSAYPYEFTKTTMVRYKHTYSA